MAKRGMTKKGALTVLKKEANFLGMTVTQVLSFCEETPMAFSEKAREATRVYMATMRENLE